MLDPSGNDSSPRASLAEVARGFWWPIYGEARDGGWNPADAAALTGRVLGRVATGSPFLRHEDHEGRLRLLLQAELLVVAEQVRSGVPGPAAPSGFFVDLVLAEERDDYGPVAPAARRFRERWAAVVLERALEGVRRRAPFVPWGARLERLIPFLATEAPDWHQTDITVAVDASEVSNLRDDFRREVLRIVGETVTSPVILESELLGLFS
ncbi:MAG: hypothetical protein JNL10_02585 [Verrucomicrobiales bacterium]|nr:hypothetical protein [Verrucomicrobiales bacterium]